MAQCRYARLTLIPCGIVTDLLAQECKQLLSRMLVTDPATRATLREVLNHPWMLRDFDGPHSHHLHPRKPLRPVFLDQPSNASSPLDNYVISRMVGFGFGSYTEIEEKLLDVLTTEEYRKAVATWGCREGIPNRGPTSARTWSFQMLPESGASTSCPSLVKQESFCNDADRIASPNVKSKASSVLRYLKKKLFNLGSALRINMTAPSDIPHSVLDLTNAEYPNPTQGYHPVLSIYFLVREKMERETVYRSGVSQSA